MLSAAPKIRPVQGVCMDEKVDFLTRRKLKPRLRNYPHKETELLYSSSYVEQ
jgi:hypothetical protein